jgi:hypothetical protein
MYLDLVERILVFWSWNLAHPHKSALAEYSISRERRIQLGEKGRFNIFIAVITNQLTKMLTTG